MKNKINTYYEIINYRGGTPARCFAISLMVNKLHWHQDVEIMWCLRGSYRIIIDDREYMQRAGDIVVINPGEVHGIFDGSEDVQQIVFSVGERICREMNGHIISFNTAGKGVAEADEFELKKAILAIYRIFDKEEDNEEYVRIIYKKYSKVYKILEILSKYIIKNNENIVFDRDLPDILKECIDYMQKNYNTQITPESVSHVLGISKATLYRMLKQNINMSFVEYLNYVRIQSAEQMLVTGNAEIIEVADACGFSSLSNFYRVFKAATGISPKEYRDKRRSRNSGMYKNSNFMNNDYKKLEAGEIEWSKIIQRNNL